LVKFFGVSFISLIFSVKVFLKIFLSKISSVHTSKNLKMAMESQSFYLSLADDYETNKLDKLKNIFSRKKRPSGQDDYQEKLIPSSKSKKDGNTGPPSSCASKTKYAIMLFLICWLGITCFIAMESAVPMEKSFMDAFNGTLTHNMFMDFTTFFSLPNIPGSFVGGFIVEAMGYRSATAIFMVTTIIGQIILCYGVYITQMNIVLLGRCIFGLSCEIISISGYTYVYKWFSGPWFNLVFAIRVSTARVGASAVTLFGQKVYAKFMDASEDLTPKLALVAFFGCTVVSLVLGFVGSIIMLFFKPDEPASEKKENEKDNKLEEVKLSDQDEEKEKSDLWTKTKETRCPRSSR